MPPANFISPLDNVTLVQLLQQQRAALDRDGSSAFIVPIVNSFRPAVVPAAAHAAAGAGANILERFHVLGKPLAYLGRDTWFGSPRRVHVTSPHFPAWTKGKVLNATHTFFRHRIQTHHVMSAGLQNGASREQRLRERERNKGWEGQLDPPFDHASQQRLLEWRAGELQGALDARWQAQEPAADVHGVA